MDGPIWSPDAIIIAQNRAVAGVATCVHEECRTQIKEADWESKAPDEIVGGILITRVACWTQDVLSYPI